MAGQKDFLDILREIRGSARPGQPVNNGIWYELTMADKNGNPGIYGDILAKYGVIAENSPTLEQAVAILENLNIEVTTLSPGANATSELIDGKWYIGIPRGTEGADGLDGLTAIPELTYDPITGELKFEYSLSPIQDERFVEW